MSFHSANHPFPYSTSIHSTTYRTTVSDTLDICAGGEEAALARQHCENRVWVLVQHTQRGDGVGDEVAAEGVEGLGAVELNRTIS